MQLGSMKATSLTHTLYKELSPLFNFCLLCHRCDNVQSDANLYLGSNYDDW